MIWNKKSKFVIVKFQQSKHQISNKFNSKSRYVRSSKNVVNFVYNCFCTRNFQCTSFIIIKWNERNYKIHLKLSNHAIISKFHRARMKIYDETCLKIFVFDRKFRILRSFQKNFIQIIQCVIRENSILLHRLIILNEFYNFMISLYYYNNTH